MIENTINFYKKLEKDMSDSVRSYTTFSVSPRNPILWGMEKNFFP